MKILHTSDWHIGRSFHGNSTIAHLRLVLDALVDRVTEYGVDVVVVSGDIFDSATPAAENYNVLTESITKLRAAGARVVMTSGNHDSATRLGFNAGFTALSGVHIHTRPERCHEPVTILDEHGPVHFYGIPYLEPSIVRHHFSGDNVSGENVSGDNVSGENVVNGHSSSESLPAMGTLNRLRTHEQVLSAAMKRIRHDLSARGGRSVVLAHAFIADVQAANVEAAADSAQLPHSASPTDEAVPGLERDITSGGLDLVSLSVFDGPDYVALGHIHGRATLSERARYSGAPLHYSFGEARKSRGAWLVELTAAGLSDVQWMELPVPRRLTVLTGQLDELVTDVANAEFENDWISAILTDRVRPLDAMRLLQSRFTFAATLQHRPSTVSGPLATSYGARIAEQYDHEIVDGFLELVRNGVGASDTEKILIANTISEAAAGAVAQSVVAEGDR